MREGRAILLAAGAIVAISLAFAPQTAKASPSIATATGKDCDACHIAGREQEGKNALTPAGESFLQAYANCGYQLDCAISNWSAAAPAQQPQPDFAPQPQPNYAPRPTYAPQPQPDYGAPPARFLNRFYDHCAGSGSYFVVKPGGGSKVRFTLNDGNEMYLEIAAGAPWVSACGGWPGENGPWNSANPGD